MDPHLNSMQFQMHPDTPMMNPTATACMEMSKGIPNSEHAIGISNNEPPTTPEAPHAANVEIMHRTRIAGNVTEIPRVWQSAKVIIVMVIAAPPVLIVAPNGTLIE